MKSNSSTAISPFYNRIQIVCAACGALGLLLCLVRSETDAPQTVGTFLVCAGLGASIGTHREKPKSKRGLRRASERRP